MAHPGSVCVVVSVEDAKAVKRAGKDSVEPLSAQKLGQFGTAGRIVESVCVVVSVEDVKSR